MADPKRDAPLDVVVSRTIFSSAATAFRVVAVESADGPIVVAGDIPFEVHDGDVLTLKGEFENHSRHGRRFLVSGCELRAPTSHEGIRKFLSSGRVKGLGPKLAARLVDAFGTETLQVLEEDPERARSVRGIGHNRLGELRRLLKDSRVEREALVFLHGLGLGPVLAREVYKCLGTDTVGRVRDNPYALSGRVRGLGFATTDRMGRALGIAPDSEVRIRAGLHHVLEIAQDHGHCALPEAELLSQARGLLEVPEESLAAVYRNEFQRGSLIVHAPRSSTEAAMVFSPVFHAIEIEVATRLHEIRTHSTPRSGTISLSMDVETLTLSAEQRVAAELLLNSKVSFLTGGPGVGKTTVLRSVVLSFAAAGLRVALASPTGRAARRLSASVGAEAHTLHRLFGFAPIAEFLDRRAPLDTDVLIIDEVSMLDIVLLVRVLRQVASTIVLIGVGDPDQLPSVGPGQVLSDLVSSEVFPVARLTKIYRQAQTSLIVENAHRIHHGLSILEGDRDRDSDFYFVERADDAASADMVHRLFHERIPKRFGLSPKTDIQVLTPMHRGPVGTISLNARLQEALVQTGSILEFGDRRFAIGDRVMMTRNDYDREVLNGDVGHIVDLDAAAFRVVVRFDDRELAFEKKETEALSLAYCITVHKSQGGEYPAVIMTLSNSHALLLRRNVLYTAITRAQRVLVLVGSRRALESAIRNDDLAWRHSRLLDRLRGEPIRILS